MSDKEIFLKAINKAIVNGFHVENPIHGDDSVDQMVSEAWNMIEEYSYMLPYVVNPIIFSHSFAKAFWGEKLISLGLYVKEPPFADERAHLPAFAYHLQKMVLEENPIQYLEKFL